MPDRPPDRPSLAALPDAHVIADSLAEPDGFAAIFDRHYDRIAGYLRRRVEPFIADELAAQTFLVAFEQRAGYDPHRLNAAPWLYGIATNLMRRHWRTERRRWRAYAEHATGDAVGPAAPDLDARADASAAAPAIARSLARLRRGDRDALLLLAWAELSYPEIAAALSIPVGTVRSRINRARRLLADDPDLGVLGAAAPSPDAPSPERPAPDASPRPAPSQHTASAAAPPPQPAELVHRPACATTAASHRSEQSA